MTTPHPVHTRLTSSARHAHSALALSAATGLRPDLAAFFALASPPGRTASTRPARNHD